MKLQDNNNKRFHQWCRGGADSAREPASMGSVFIAGFGFNNILLLLLLPNRILRSLDKMINDKEMEEILDEMKKEKKEGKNDINSVNNADFVGLKVRSRVTTDPETSAAPVDPSSKERVEGLKREEMRCSQLGYYRGSMLIVMVVEMRKRKMRKRKMRKKKKKERTGRSMEEND